MGRFYHYTDEKGYKAILKSRKIKKSKMKVGDAVYGTGVYLTRLSPQDRTKGGIARNNYGHDSLEKARLKDGRVDYWFEFDIDEARLENVSGERDIWLLMNSSLKFDDFLMTNHGKFEN